MSEKDDNALYMLLGEMRGDLKSILSAFSGLRDDHRQLKEDTERLAEKHDIRLTNLEKLRWQIAGVAFVIPIVVTVVGWFMKGM